MDRTWRWRWAAAVHRWDYARLLPWMARQPLAWAYGLSHGRGCLNALLGRDWRSMALRTRHIRRMSLEGAMELVRRGLLPRERVRACVAERFSVEARDEFEAQLMRAGRLGELKCRFEPADAPQRLQQVLQARGAVLLTPHFDSFYLGIAFLARVAGVKLNAMASAVPSDPRVDPAVTAHFDQKYRALEGALNGGGVVDMEDGLRAFYRMLQAREGLVVLADAPVLPGGARMAVPFLGTTRVLAGGPMRLAAATHAAVAAFVCRHEGGARYVLQWCDAGEPHAAHLAHLYGFLSDAITRDVGRWWAMDLLPNLPPRDDARGAAGPT